MSKFFNSISRNGGAGGVNSQSVGINRSAPEAGGVTINTVTNSVAPQKQSRAPQTGGPNFFLGGPPTKVTDLLRTVADLAALLEAAEQHPGKRRPYKKRVAA
jgi:hypothetical protein